MFQHKPRSCITFASSSTPPLLDLVFVLLLKLSWCRSTCTWQIWIPLSSLHPPILGSCPSTSLRRRTRFWIGPFTCLNNASSPKSPSSTKDFPEFPQCVFSQLHCPWRAFICCPGPSRDLFLCFLRILSRSILAHYNSGGFPITSSGASFQNILLEPPPLAPP